MSFKRLDPEDISISAESVVAPLWSTGASTLVAFHTSSTQVAGNLGNYFTDVYQLDTTDVSSQVQFSIAYGDRLGSGSAPYNVNVTGSTPTSAIYGQYRSLILGDEDAAFTFGTITSDKIFAVTADRSRYKEKLLPGTFNMRLTSGSLTLNLTDNSNDLTSISYTDSGRVYDIISGSNGKAIAANSGLHPTLQSTYGKYLPDIGIIILNANALNTTTGGVNLRLTSGSLDSEKNSNRLYNAISAGAATTLQSEETISSNYVFVRARNGEFNYSTNPSNITGSGELRHDIMINTPQSYVTTVGLYNDNNELLAVAKLSRALLKDFTKEALIRIKLDY